MHLDMNSLLCEVSQNLNFMFAGGTNFNRACRPQLQSILGDCKALTAGRAGPA